MANGVSAYVLACMKALYGAYPDPVDATELAQEDAVAGIGVSLLGVFVKAGLLQGDPARMMLTAAGHKALATAVQSPGGLAQFFSGEKVGDPDKVLLTLLRLAFDAQTEFSRASENEPARS